MADVLVGEVPATGQAGAPELAREVDVLAVLLAGAISGRGFRGPSTDAQVLARRLVESERVRVDVPGRLTIDQVVDLAQRCGRAETALRVERARAEQLVAEADRLRSQVAELLPYAIAGSESMQMWEPYGCMIGKLMTADEWEKFCEGAEAMFDRIRAGEFGSVLGEVTA